MAPQTDLIEYVKATAPKYGLDPALVCAVIEKESEWNPWAVRAEPEFDKKYVQPLHKTPTEEWCRSISWGLMQLMGESARERGYDGDLPALLDPAIGVPWGCTHLKWKIDRMGGDVFRSLLAWNGGADSGYPADVLSRMKKYQGGL